MHALPRGDTTKNSPTNMHGGGNTEQDAVHRLFTSCSVPVLAKGLQTVREIRSGEAS